MINPQPTSYIVAVEESTPAVHLFVGVGENTLQIRIDSAAGIDVLIERLKLARVAAFGLDVASRQPIGHRHQGG